MVATLLPSPVELRGLQRQKLMLIPADKRGRMENMNLHLWKHLLVRSLFKKLIF